jgi:hypothetical protein
LLKEEAFVRISSEKEGIQDHNLAVLHDDAITKNIEHHDDADNRLISS